MGSVLSLGLNDTVAVGAFSLARVHKLDARFVTAGIALGAHALGHIDRVARNRLKSYQVGDTINQDLSLWIW